MKIEVRDLVCTYNTGMDNEIRALDGISFTIGPGSFTGIIGHTGSGKSTLVQHLNGLMKPASGKVILDDTDLSSPKINMAEIRKKVGLVFQYPEYQLFEETVAEDIAFGPRNMKLEEDEVRERVREAMRTVGLPSEEFAERSPFELSGGQKRRVAIAGVIAMRPEVLILDEPAAGLDPAAHREMLGMIRRFHEERGTTIILVSHNMDDVAEYCEEVLVLDRGRLLCSGTPQEVFSCREKLEAVGLGLPSGSELICLLEERGAVIDGWGVLNDEEAAEAVYDWIMKERGGMT
ncbi:MAG: energy-coupling factor transporter ATPase [Firmicutes bacterium]|nr:energy-coupling factor transporter ATPase [Bacillota bacterium]